MRRIISTICILTSALTLAGCSYVKIDEVDMSEILPTFDEISLEEVGQEAKDMLKAEWDEWIGKDEFEQLISSKTPGYCYQGFNSWEDVEEFLGFAIANPLEDLEWLEKGSYVGMLEGLGEIPRFNISFHGTKEGQIEWFNTESGYLDGDIRIVVDTQVKIDESGEENSEPVISQDSGEDYTATTAVLTIGPVTYNIRVIGDPGTQEKVQETLDKILPYFENLKKGEKE